MLLVTCLPACGSGHTRISSLQRLNDLAPQLRHIAAEAKMVSFDVASLDHAVQSGGTTVARRRANRLKEHATYLRNQAGRVGNAVRHLERATPNAHVRAFLETVTSTLTAQFWEGATLVRLAEVMWRDPFIMYRASVVQVRSLSASARRYSLQSVQLVESALALKQHYHKAFDYVPVHESKTQSIRERS